MSTTTINAHASNRTLLLPAFSYTSSTFVFSGDSGPNLDLICVRQPDAAPVCENYAKLYLDAKHLENGLGLVKFLVPFPFKKVSFLANVRYWPNFLD